MQQLNWYWRVLRALTSRWGVLPHSLYSTFFPLRRLAISDADKTVLCWRSASTHRTHQAANSLFNIFRGEPFRWIDFQQQCSICCGLDCILLSVYWECFYPATFVEYIRCYCVSVVEIDVGSCTKRFQGKHIGSLYHKDTGLWELTAALYLYIQWTPTNSVLGFALTADWS